ncbi:futalosine nucleosidase [Rhodopirellula sp. SWK7]|uniref:phosphorylase family protein n=1 Tax=Rhodopirellula sp. SWK7 TaxID=595460 RepID=UPI0002BE8DBD|nr:futalosine nucleosidase [Rhodopirellula sp. SWK7]EMI42459.1 futalosine nucleosidase [Rhodopirellula sp. SWK7]
MVKTLLLVPTAMERDRLMIGLADCGEAGALFAKSTRVELCGFGIAAAGALTMQHLSMHRPERVVLAGIAGSLRADSQSQSECQVGAAYWFDTVVIDGIGVGEQSSFVSANEMGWQHVAPEVETPGVGDRIELFVPGSVSPRRRQRCLVTGCAGSSNRSMAVTRSQRVQKTLQAMGETDTVVAAEDMEGFSVALACEIASLPLSIVRGISNQAGDRDHAGWQIDEAINAVAKGLVEHFG